MLHKSGIIAKAVISARPDIRIFLEPIRNISQSNNVVVKLTTIMHNIRNSDEITNASVNDDPVIKVAKYPKVYETNAFVPNAIRGIIILRESFPFRKTIE